MLLSVPAVIVVATPKGVALPEGTKDTEAFLRSHIQQGIPIEQAKSQMEGLGFSCSWVSKGAIAGVEGVADFVYCDREKGSLMVIKRWQAALMYSNGKLSEIHATFGLIGS